MPTTTGRSPDRRPKVVVVVVIVGIFVVVFCGDNRCDMFIFGCCGDFVIGFVVNDVMYVA